MRTFLGTKSELFLRRKPLQEVKDVNQSKERLQNQTQVKRNYAWTLVFCLTVFDGILQTDLLPALVYIKYYFVDDRFVKKTRLQDSRDSLTINHKMQTYPCTSQNNFLIVYRYFCETCPQIYFKAKSLPYFYFIFI